MNKKGILLKLKKNKEAIKSFGVKRMLLVGSYAHSTQKKDSDIDLVIEFKKNRGSFDDYAHLHQFLEDLFKKKIDMGEISLLREELKPSIFGGGYLEAEI
ncbi:nucleotidyltransferase domain-containing protein [Candidatus Woesearchaeota archaeon]|nr:nucleotidyltransferase domain-containing protein [Candidatus Woesearchaeota archaeon]